MNAASRASTTTLRTCGHRGPRRVVVALTAGALAMTLATAGAGAANGLTERHPDPRPRIDPLSVKTPSELYGDLFVKVQMRDIFVDGKTFVDAVPKRPVADIMKDYQRQKPTTDAALKSFALKNFVVPGVNDGPPKTVPVTQGASLQQHIKDLWPHLTRPAVKSVKGGSALSLPEPFVVPGGRFREMYYWDSYFTMLGLKADGQNKVMESTINDFVSLVERYGHIPNGTRSYYLSRSQPPFLYLMVGLSDTSNDRVKARRLAAVKAEYAYMTSKARTVSMPDGSKLQHYWGALATPRDESYLEDVETAHKSGRPKAQIYRDLRAGAESGWDYSSRWFADGKSITTIDTTNIVPVDLNSLLYGMETSIAQGCRQAADRACAQSFTNKAQRRAKTINTYLWSNSQRRYGDWDVKKSAIRPGITAATAFPLFVGLAPTSRANELAGTIKAQLLAPGGLRTTTVKTGQQWDEPNGWAPLQWVAVEGLEKNGQHALAKTISDRFLTTVLAEYNRSGKLVEKYNIESQAGGGGGEYALQDGFGWSNGVTRALIEKYGMPK